MLWKRQWHGACIVLMARPYVGSRTNIGVAASAKKAKPHMPDDGARLPDAGLTHSTPPPRVVLLTAQGDLAQIVRNAFAASFDNLTIITEQPEPKSQIIKRRARLRGWPSAISQAVVGLLLRITAKRSAARVDDICRAGGLNRDRNTDQAASAQTFSVTSVNTDRARALIRSANPNIVAVYGTRLLNAATLDAVAAPFINYHAGLTPKYRGQHPGYWALASDDASGAGVTVHLVDTGVDTGCVLAQAHVPLSADADNITTYQFVQMSVGLPLFITTVTKAIAPNGADFASPPSQTRACRPVAKVPRTHLPPTLGEYLRHGIRQGVW